MLTILLLSIFNSLIFDILNNFIIISIKINNIYILLFK